MEKLNPLKGWFDGWRKGSFLLFKDNWTGGFGPVRNILGIITFPAINRSLRPYQTTATHFAHRRKHDSVIPIPGLSLVPVSHSSFVAQRIFNSRFICVYVRWWWALNRQWATHTHPLSMGCCSGGWMVGRESILHSLLSLSLCWYLSLSLSTILSLLSSVPRLTFTGDCVIHSYR